MVFHNPSFILRFSGAGDKSGKRRSSSINNHGACSFGFDAERIAVVFFLVVMLTMGVANTKEELTLPIRQKNLYTA